MGDIQEMSFQNVVDTILKPEGVTVGGYPDDIFLDVFESEREQWQCNICYLISRNVRQCDNKHLFCATCAFAWSMTYGANSDKCPVCRSKQAKYEKNSALDDTIGRKRVKCPEKGCGFQAPLHYFLKHSHGMKLYGLNVDLEKLNRARPAPVPTMAAHRHMFLPSLRVEAENVREGRNLLQDMMLVLHLEMELRRRAIDRFSIEENDRERFRHMSEVLAIQEQMQEITGFLNLLFSIPPPSSLSGHASTSRQRIQGSSQECDEDSDSSSDSSESSGVVSQYRLAERQRQMQRSALLSENRVIRNSPESLHTPVPPNVPRSPGHNRPRRRSDIREDLLRSNEASTSTSSESTGSTVRTIAHRTQQPAPTQSLNRVGITIDVNNNNELGGRNSRAQHDINISSTNLFPVNSVVENPEPEETAEELGGRSSRVHEDINLSSTNLLPVNSAVENLEPEETAEPVDTRDSIATSTQSSLPRPSSTFQSVLDTLPPISSPIVARQTSQTSTSGRNSVTSLPPRPSAGVQTNNQEPRRRPVPPSVVNPQRRVVRRSGRTDAATSQTRSSAGQSNQSASSTSTSGALMRSRRRSEILQEIRNNLASDSNGTQ